MDRAKKEKLDALWLDTDFGQWAAFASQGKTDEAGVLKEKIFHAGHWGGLGQMEAEIGESLTAELESADEWDEYLKLLNEEDPALVRFAVVHSLFCDAIMRLNTH